ncbi:hypothetical protein BJX70DRAFT_52801 [Aspergillus crustosus]
MSNNPHDYNGNGPNRQGQYPPPQWNTSQPDENPAARYPPTSQYPYPPASYPPPPAPEHQYPPPHSQYPPHQTNMAAVHPAAVHGSQNHYQLPPPPPPPAPLVFQAAPRQRTAIACRYCRRRKIRCSGFESNPEGRCSNCIRFNQQCMFTPVSSQAQAFVPAHAAYPHMRNQGRNGGEPVVLYGAHGQPLPPQQQPQAGPESTLPPPQGMYQHPYGSAPPPLASMPQDHRPRRGSGSGFDYPDPTNLAPVTPVTSGPYQPRAAPYYPPPPPHDRRPSPQSAYSYDNRHSSSPHGSPYPPMHSQSAITPPPTSTPGSAPRNGLNVRDMLNPGENPGRSSTDSDMLNALNRRGLGQ